MVEDEVKRQIASMQALDEGGEPNFNDADYQLAAYAAALKVLTQYGTLDGKDVEHEVFAVRTRTRKAISRPSSSEPLALPATHSFLAGWTTPGAIFRLWSATTCVHLTLKVGANAAKVCMKSLPVALA